MEFVITNLNSKSLFQSATVYNVDDLLFTLSVMKSTISNYTLKQVEFFACSSFDLYYVSKKYKFFVRKVVK